MLYLLRYQCFVEKYTSLWYIYHVCPWTSGSLYVIKLTTNLPGLPYGYWKWTPNSRCLHNKVRYFRGFYVLVVGGAYLYINLTLTKSCVFPYSSFIIALKTTELGMYTLLELMLHIGLCCNKKPARCLL
jgi:hypothetical protein